MLASGCKTATTELKSQLPHRTDYEKSRLKTRASPRWAETISCATSSRSLHSWTLAPQQAFHNQQITRRVKLNLHMPGVAMKNRDTTTCVMAFTAALFDCPMRSPSSVNTGMPCISSLKRHTPSQSGHTLLQHPHDLYTAQSNGNSSHLLQPQIITPVTISRFLYSPGQAIITVCGHPQKTTFSMASIYPSIRLPVHQQEGHVLRWPSDHASSCYNKLSFSFLKLHFCQFHHVLPASHARNVDAVGSCNGSKWNETTNQRRHCLQHGQSQTYVTTNDRQQTESNDQSETA